MHVTGFSAHLSTYMLFSYAFASPFEDFLVFASLRIGSRRFQPSGSSIWTRAGSRFCGPRKALKAAWRVPFPKGKPGERWDPRGDL